MLIPELKQRRANNGKRIFSKGFEKKIAGKVSHHKKIF
jgi:hypothetical protein